MLFAADESVIVVGLHVAPSSALVKYVASALVAIPLGLIAFLAWPVDYDGQAAGVMQIGVRDPLVELAATVAFGFLVLALCAIAVGRLRLRSCPGSRG